MFVPPDEPAGVYLLTSETKANRLAGFGSRRISRWCWRASRSTPARSRSAATGIPAPCTSRTRGTRSAPARRSWPCRRPLTKSRRTAAGSSAPVRISPVRISSNKPGRTSHPLMTTGRSQRSLHRLMSPREASTTIVVILGQADDRAKAEAVVRKYQSPDAARAALEATRHWWLELMDTVQVETSDPEFDRYLDWLKYQALAERIWARRGFYQASGAFGFRDQLQDSVNLIWMDPSIARRQILLHASQQFPEGDVVHWFHRFQDGRTGFVARTHASDNLLWLAWAVVEYVAATGDESLLDEETPYLEAEQPFPPLPAGKHGMGFDPLRSFRADSVYRHAMAAIDLVLDRRMGAHGLPLIGTGDWNDGLDEIGSQGRGESVWLGFFLYYILDRMTPIIEKKDGPRRLAHYTGRMRELKDAIEATWRGDRYLRAIHDDGTEIGVERAASGRSMR